MKTDPIIVATEQFVKDRLSGEGTGHDWWHATRVRNIAKNIHTAEGGNWLTIDLALLLHDVGDRKVINQDNDDYTIAEDFLSSQELPAKTVTSIMNIIKTMSYSKSFDDITVDRTTEFQIVQDADRLDAIGAIGIARAFTYGGSRARPLYDPDYTSPTFSSSADYKRADGSTFHHFAEKLLLLKDRLNTDTAKQIAQHRHDYMVQFLNEFMNEWNGIT
ncbi:MAG: HD domain-containing protein [Chloroflexi bacterium]|nr:MAG: HD domain-containing protein [Chloroflexota bacterium]